MPEAKRPIGLIVATPFEAPDLVEQLGLVPDESSPFRTYVKNDCVLVLSGVGKANAAAATAFLLQKFRPIFVLNAGACGDITGRWTLGARLQVGEIFEPDRPISGTDAWHTHQAAPFDGYESCRLATHDRAITDDENRAPLIDADIDIVDMEGAAIVQTCNTFQTPVHLLKFVSDTPSSGDIFGNIKQLAPDFVNHLVNQTIPALARHYEERIDLPKVARDLRDRDPLKARAWNQPQI